MPRTLSYVDILYLQKPTLIDVCSAFPQADKRIRRAQIRTATFRAFIKAAREEAGRFKERRTLRQSNAVVQSNAITSFVNPGVKERRLNRTSMSCLKDEVSMTDIKGLIEALIDNQDVLDRKLDVLTRSFANGTTCEA